MITTLQFNKMPWFQTTTWPKLITKAVEWYRLNMLQLNQLTWTRRQLIGMATCYKWIYISIWIQAVTLHDQMLVCAWWTYVSLLVEPRMDVIALRINDFCSDVKLTWSKAYLILCYYNNYKDRSPEIALVITLSNIIFCMNTPMYPHLATLMCVYMEPISLTIFRLQIISEGNFTRLYSIPINLIATYFCTWHDS